MHLKVDTGMSRLGSRVAELPAVLDARSRIFRRCGWPGLCTHFASADVADRGLRARRSLGSTPCLSLARARAGFAGLVNHAANSAAAVRFPAARFERGAPGAGALRRAAVARRGAAGARAGAEPDDADHGASTTIAVGTAVSYGGLWRAARPSRIATLPIGYADGYPRHVRGQVLVRGRRVRSSGAVCMDM